MAKKYEVLFGRTSDRQDSVATKISRLMSLQNKFERRLVTIARKEGLGNVNPENEDTHEQPEKILLQGSGSGISVYSPATGQVF